MKRSKVSIIILFLILSIVFSGCGTGNTTTQQQNTPKSNNNQVLRFNLGREPAPMDPQKKNHLLKKSAINLHQALIH